MAITRYIHRDPEYVPQARTNNNHVLIWEQIKNHIHLHGAISRNTLMGLCLTYGEGLNRNNENYGHYLIDAGRLVKKVSTKEEKKPK